MAGASVLPGQPHGFFPPSCPWHQFRRVLRYRPWQDHDEVGMAGRDQLDGVDLKILSELQQDGRVRNNELALRVGVSAPNCLRRLKSLFSRGVIRAVRAVIDERLLGYEVVSFVSIQLGSQAQPLLEAFE